MERDRAIIEHAADAFFVYEAGGKIFDVNRRACRTLGYTREELLSLSMTDVEAILLPEGIAGLWRRLASGEPVTAEGAHRRKDGTAFPAEIRFGLLGEAAGRRLALSIARDITGRRALEEGLSHQALHDPLTGLPNRALLMDRLEHAVARAHRRKTPLTVLFLDLDDFKAVNDASGHERGDRLLEEVSRRLEPASGLRREILGHRRAPRRGRVRRLARRHRRRKGGGSGGRPDKKGARGPLRGGRARALGHSEHRRRRGAILRGRASGAAARRGPGDVPGQGERQEPPRCVRPRAPGARAYAIG